MRSGNWKILELHVGKQLGKGAEDKHTAETSGPCVHVIAYTDLIVCQGVPCDCMGYEQPLLSVGLVEINSSCLFQKVHSTSYLVDIQWKIGKSPIEEYIRAVRF